MLVLLDLDGTLTNPLAGMARSILHAFATVGVTAPDLDVIRSMIGPPFQETFPFHGIPEARVMEAVHAYRAAYDGEGLMFDAALYDGALAALDALLADGHRLALATSKPETSATKIARHFGIAERLEFLGAASDDGTRRAKGDVIAHVLRSLDVDAGSCVMVGDRDVDILGARAHGISCVSVRWGYAAEGELEALGPATIVDHPSELPGAVWSLSGRDGERDGERDGGRAHGETRDPDALAGS